MRSVATSVELPALEEARTETLTMGISFPSIIDYSMDMELIFGVQDAEEGGYCARALGHSIFTQGETWEDLRANVLEATSLHFEDERVHPRIIQLHYVKDELIPIEAA